VTKGKGAFLITGVSQSRKGKGRDAAGDQKQTDLVKENLLQAKKSKRQEIKGECGEKRRECISSTAASLTSKTEKRIYLDGVEEKRDEPP